MKTPTVTIRLTSESKHKLKKIAEAFDLTYHNSGSIAQLLEAIANNELIVSKNFSKNLDR